MQLVQQNVRASPTISRKTYDNSFATIFTEIFRCSLLRGDELSSVIPLILQQDANGYKWFHLLRFRVGKRINYTQDTVFRHLLASRPGSRERSQGSVCYPRLRIRNSTIDRFSIISRLEFSNEEHGRAKFSVQQRGGSVQYSDSW